MRPSKNRRRPTLPQLPSLRQQPSFDRKTLTGLGFFRRGIRRACPEGRLVPEPEPVVLVVDDDANIRRMIMAALRRDGYRFIEAANGREALDAMRREHPVAVVLDLMMPIVSGWDVLRERATDDELMKIAVIVVSATRS